MEKPHRGGEKEAHHIRHHIRQGQPHHHHLQVSNCTSSDQQDGMFGGHLESSVQDYDKLWLSEQSSGIIGQEQTGSKSKSNSNAGQGTRQKTEVLAIMYV